MIIDLARAACLLVLVCLASPGAIARDDGEAPDIRALLAAEGGFDMLLQAFAATDLDARLSGDEPVTLFAPSDEALRRLPADLTRKLMADRDQLTLALSYHLAQGAWRLDDIGRVARIPSLEGSDLGLRQLEGDLYAIDSASLVRTDLVAANGVVHVIDGLLLPPGLEIITDAELYGGGRQAYTVDTEHSSILFRVLHMDVGAAWGWFERFQGELVVDADEPEKSTILMAVDVSSLSTRNKARDDYLQTKDFFDAANNPALTFRSTKVEPLGGGDLRVTGQLGLRGIEQTVTFDARKLGEGRFGPRQYKLGYEAELSIKRSDFGMTYGIPGVAADEVRITVALEANRPLEP